MTSQAILKVITFILWGCGNFIQSIPYLSSDFTQIDNVDMLVVSEERSGDHQNIIVNPSNPVVEIFQSG